MVILRDYQNEVKAKLYSLLKKDFKTNVLLVKPTGSGKTKTFCSVVRDMAITEIFNESLPTWILVHRKELLGQISISLCEEQITHNIIAPAPTVRNIISLQRLQFGKQFYNHKSNISIASIDTVNSRASNYDQQVKSVRLVIVDEAAHVLKKNKWGRALQLFPKATIIGVTATPQRLDKKGLGSDNDGVFDKMIEGPKVSWLIENGFLSKYKIVAPPSDFEKYLGHVKSNQSDYSNEVISDAANKSRIVGDVVENYIKFAKGKQTIVFAPTLESAEKMEQSFTQSGIPAKLLSSLSTDKERFDGVQDFKNNKIQVLLNVDLFDEGFDIPVAPGKKIVEAVIIARPTMSLTKFLQQVGRALRPAPNKEYALIIDHVGNIKRHGLPDKQRKWSLDRPEKRNKTSSLVRVCTSCSAAYERTESKCPYCGTPAIVAGGGGGRVPPQEVDGDLELIDPDTIREMNDATILDAPERVGERVASVAGEIAGKSAAKKQRERIATQDELKNIIALWAGKQRLTGLDDRSIHKKFFIDYGSTISQSLGQPRLQMQNMIDDLKVDVEHE